MDDATAGFQQRIERLRSALTPQGSRVQSMVEDAIDAVLAGDAALAADITARDTEVDRIDLEIERTAVALLTEVARTAVALTDADIRMVLTVVKVNNELERIGDLAVDLVQTPLAAVAPGAGSSTTPQRLRVMANSVIGILQHALAAWGSMDAATARVVLSSEDATEAFENSILAEAHRGIADGALSPAAGFSLLHIARHLERAGDHCSNIAEQVIYVATGKVVRHTDGCWSTPETPD